MVPKVKQHDEVAASSFCIALSRFVYTAHALKVFSPVDDVIRPLNSLPLLFVLICLLLAPDTGPPGPQGEQRHEAEAARLTPMQLHVGHAAFDCDSSSCLQHRHSNQDITSPNSNGVSLHAMHISMSGFKAHPLACSRASLLNFTLLLAGVVPFAGPPGFRGEGGIGAGEGRGRHTGACMCVDM